MKNRTLMTDDYEYTMAYTYFKSNKQNEVAYFDLFFRTNPFGSGYSISCGLDNIIEFIKNINFDEERIEFLRKRHGFDEDFLEYLKNLKFTGDIFAIPDGTVVFPNEPVITVKANLIESQIIETALLSYFNHGSLIATSAKRITEAAQNRPVMEFGARRCQGEASIEASKYAIIGGCSATSNDEAAYIYNLPVSGTMAHSMIEAYDNEEEAFIEYAKANPNNCIFLVDTYDVLNSGIPNAIKVAQKFLIPNGFEFKGIRIDSGDLAYLSKEARKMLDAAGFKNTKICLSNGLDEKTVNSLINQCATFDSIGAGDNIVAPKERFNAVYKLVAIEENGKIDPRIKLSNDTAKTINPGYKKVYRFYDKNTGYALGDVITLNDEKISEESYTLICPTDINKTKTITNYNVRELQVPIFLDGIQVYDEPTINERKEYCKTDFNTFYPEIKRLDNPHEYYVDLSEKLLNLKQELITKYKGKVKVKK